MNGGKSQGGTVCAYAEIKLSLGFIDGISICGMQRKPTVIKKQMLVCLALALASTSVLEAQQTLVGTWERQDGESRMTFSFFENGTGKWSVVVPGDHGFSDVFEFDFLVDYGTIPHRVDIMNIDHGFLANKTMYGVFRLEGEGTMILDFEPGSRDGDGSTVRPHDFTESAITLARIHRSG